MLDVHLIRWFRKTAQLHISIVDGQYIFYLTSVVHNVQVLALIKVVGFFKRVVNWLGLSVSMDLSLFREGTGFA